jgi:hypothetical protein
MIDMIYLKLYFIEKKTLVFELEGVLVNLISVKEEVIKYDSKV